MTLLHLAEMEAGRRPFIRWALGNDGHPLRVVRASCMMTDTPNSRESENIMTVYDSIGVATPVFGKVIRVSRAIFIWRSAMPPRC